MIAAAPRDQWRVRFPDTRLLIDGESVDAVSGERFDTYDPSTEQVIASVSRAGPQDADRAVAAARRARRQDHRRRRPDLAECANVHWGGAGGESGISRDLGAAAIDNYTEKKTVWVDLRR